MEKIPERDDVLAEIKTEADLNEAMRLATSRLVEENRDVIRSSAEANNTTFLMPISAVYSTAALGCVVAGVVEKGPIKITDEAQLVGVTESWVSLVTGIIMSDRMIDEAEEGDAVTLRLRGNREVFIGQVVATPNTISSYTEFRCQIYVLTEAEGGAGGILINGGKLTFVFRTAHVVGQTWLYTGVEFGRPGETAKLEVVLIVPTPMTVGQEFSMFQGAKAYAVGVVTETTI